MNVLYFIFLKSNARFIIPKTNSTINRMSEGDGSNKTMDSKSIFRNTKLSYLNLIKNKIAIKRIVHPIMTAGS